MNGISSVPEKNQLQAVGIKRGSSTRTITQSISFADENPVPEKHKTLDDPKELIQPQRIGIDRDSSARTTDSSISSRRAFKKSSPYSPFLNPIEESWSKVEDRLGDQ